MRQLLGLGPNTNLVLRTCLRDNDASALPILLVGFVYYRFQLRGYLFSAISVKRTDKSERNLGTRGLSIGPNFTQYSLITNDQNFRALPLTRNVKHRAGSVQTKQFPREGYGCQP